MPTSTKARDVLYDAQDGQGNSRIVIMCRWPIGQRKDGTWFAIVEGKRVPVTCDQQGKFHARSRNKVFY